MPCYHHLDFVALRLSLTGLDNPAFGVCGADPGIMVDNVLRREGLAAQLLLTALLLFFRSSGQLCLLGKPSGLGREIQTLAGLLQPSQTLFFAPQIRGQFDATPILQVWRIIGGVQDLHLLLEATHLSLQVRKRPIGRQGAISCSHPDTSLPTLAKTRLVTTAKPLKAQLPGWILPVSQRNGTSLVQALAVGHQDRMTPHQTLSKVASIFWRFRKLRLQCRRPHTTFAD